MIVEACVRLKPVGFDAVALLERVAVLRKLPEDARDVLLLDALGARGWPAMIRQAARRSPRWSAASAWRWLADACAGPDGFRAIAVQNADTLPPRLLMDGVKAAKEIAPVLMLGDPFRIGGKMAGRPGFMARAIFVF